MATMEIPLTRAEVDALAKLVAVTRAATLTNGAAWSKWTRILEKLDHA